MADDGLAIKKEKITQGLAKLKERTIKYDTLQQQLDNTDDKQISTTDADTRSIIIVKNIVEVAYNVQKAVDDKHNLIVHTQATNTNDGKALHKAEIQAKNNLQLQKKEALLLLADKGYHTGAELQQYQQENIITHVHSMFVTSSPTALCSLKNVATAPMALKKSGDSQVNIIIL